MSESTFHTGYFCMLTDPCQHDCTFDGKTEQLTGMEIARKYWDRLSDKDKEHFKKYFPKEEEKAQTLSSLNIGALCNCTQDPCVHPCMVNGNQFTLNAETIVAMSWDKLKATQRKHFSHYKK